MQSACRGCLIARPYQLHEWRSQEAFGGRKRLWSPRRTLWFPIWSALEGPENLTRLFPAASPSHLLGALQISEICYCIQQYYITRCLNSPRIDLLWFIAFYWHCLALWYREIPSTGKPPLRHKVNKCQREQSVLALKSSLLSLLGFNPFWRTSICAISTSHRNVRDSKGYLTGEMQWVLFVLRPQFQSWQWVWRVALLQKRPFELSGGANGSAGTGAVASFSSHSSTLQTSSKGKKRILSNSHSDLCVSSAPASAASHVRGTTAFIKDWGLVVSGLVCLIQNCGGVENSSVLFKPPTAKWKASAQGSTSPAPCPSGVKNWAAPLLPQARLLGKRCHKAGGTGKWQDGKGTASA